MLRENENTGPYRKRIFAAPAFISATILFMGAIGAIMRYGLEILWADADFPFATLVINLIGCYALYVTYSYLGRRVHLPIAVIQGIGVGLIGAFTTLSAFCTENIALVQSGRPLLALAYILITLIGSFAASALGWVTCGALSGMRKKRLTKRRDRHRAQRNGKGEER